MERALLLLRVRHFFQLRCVTGLNGAAKLELPNGLEVWFAEAHGRIFQALEIPLQVDEATMQTPAR